LNFDHWYLPFDLAQGGEPVEPFDIRNLVLGIYIISMRLMIVKSAEIHFRGRQCKHDG